MMVQSLVGLIAYSEKVDDALAFFRDKLELPLALMRHGPIKDHYEATIGPSHLALFPGKPRLVPSFRVADLDAALRSAEARGASRVLGPLDIGEGKRVAGLAGPDGFEIRLIEIHG